MDFNVATEFMVLAATLIDIKSKMILPRATVEGEVLLEEDPRSELVEQFAGIQEVQAGCRRTEGAEGLHVPHLRKTPRRYFEYLNQPDEYLDLDIKKICQRL